MIDFQKGDMIEEEFEIIKLISQGSFGKVYKGRCISKNIKVAIKLEKDEMTNFNSLDREIEILTRLGGVPQIPQLLWHGKIGNQTIMVINLLGRDLVYYLKKYKQLSFECIYNIAYQMITILERTHKKNIIHRDIKPENILSSTTSEKLYLIDFGISKILDSQKKSKEKIAFIGTTRYASLAAHYGYDQSAKDDLESLGYVLVYLFTHSLPWQNITESNNLNNRIQRIGQMKAAQDLQVLCKDCPDSILKYLRYVRNVNGRIRPNYAMLKGLFMINYCLQQDLVFDWSLQKLQPQHSHQLEKQSQKTIKRNNHNYKSLYQVQNQNPNYHTRKIKTVAPSIEDICLEDEEEHSSYDVKKGIQQSIQVGYASSEELCKKQTDLKIYNQKIVPGTSTLDTPFPFFQQDILGLEAQQQLLESENQDLEIKYSLLYFKSVDLQIFDLQLVISKIQYRFS